MGGMDPIAEGGQGGQEAAGPSGSRQQNPMEDPEPSAKRRRIDDISEGLALMDFAGEDGSEDEDLEDEGLEGEGSEDRVIDLACMVSKDESSEDRMTDLTLVSDEKHDSHGYFMARRDFTATLRTKLGCIGIKVLEHALLPSSSLYGAPSGRLVAIKFTSHQEMSIHSQLTTSSSPCSCPYIIPLLSNIPHRNFHLVVTPLRTPLEHMDQKVVWAGADATFALRNDKNFVAYLVIRPHNLVVCQSEHRLEIIDFLLAIIKNQNAQVRGFRGYLLWVAPGIEAGG